MKASRTRSTELQDSGDTAAELKRKRRTGKLNLPALNFNVANGFHNKWILIKVGLTYPFD